MAMVIPFQKVNLVTEAISITMESLTNLASLAYLYAETFYHLKVFATDNRKTKQKTLTDWLISFTMPVCKQHTNPRLYDK